MPVGIPWQEPDGGWQQSGRTDLHTEIDTTGRTDDRRSDFDSVYGDWKEIGDRIKTGPQKFDIDILEALRSAEKDPAGLSDDAALALLHADGNELDALTRLADDLRRETVGDDITFVVTRNINFTNVCYTGCRFCAFAQRRTDADAYTLSLYQIGDRVDEAWEAGATEICMQGGIHPELPGTAYFDLAAEVKRRQPKIHLHALQPDGSRQRRLPYRSVHSRLAGQGPRGRRRFATRHGGGDSGRRDPLGPHQGQAADRRAGSRSSAPRTNSACRPHRR